MVHHYLDLLQKMREKGVKATKTTRRDLFKLVKLGLIFHQRSTNFYQLTKYGEDLLEKVEIEFTNNCARRRA
jgi:hypothetical protein